MKNYFEILGVKESFFVDKESLNQAYIAKQQQYHPDRQIDKNDSERQKAILLSMDVNAAIKILSNPVSRAKHLLELKSVFVNNDSKNDTYQPDSNILQLVMQYQEKLSNASTEELLQGLADDIASQMEQVKTQFANAYEQDNLEQAARYAIYMRYLERLEEEITLKHTQKHKQAV